MKKDIWAEGSGIQCAVPTMPAWRVQHVMSMYI